MAAVPGQEDGKLLDGHQAALRVAEGALPLVRREAAEQSYEAALKCFEQIERDLERQCAGVGQLLVVALDLRRILDQREVAAAVSVGVAAGEMVDDLTEGPAVRTVPRIELRVVESADGLAEKGRGFLQI